MSMEKYTVQTFKHLTSVVKQIQDMYPRDNVVGISRYNIPSENSLVVGGQIVRNFSQWRARGREAFNNSEVSAKDCSMQVKCCLCTGVTWLLLEVHMPCGHLSPKYGKFSFLWSTTAATSS